jgi:hypothetical protein
MKKSLLAFVLLMAGTASAAQVPNFPDPKILPTPAQKGGIPLISGGIGNLGNSRRKGHRDTQRHLPDLDALSAQKGHGQRRRGDRRPRGCIPLAGDQT